MAILNIIQEALPVQAMTETQGMTGFVDQDNIDVAYNYTNRTITITGNLTYYWRGVRKVLTSPWTSSAHTDSAGSWYLSSTNGDTFTWSNSPWDFIDIQVAAVHRGASAAATYAIRDIHGVMDFHAHEALHQLLGTYRISGGALTAATYAENTATDAGNTPGFDSALIQDEDVETSIPAWTQGTYTTMYIAASNVATCDTTATLPFRSSGSYLLVNNPVTGAEAAGINNRYYNVYQILVPTTSDSDSQKYRMILLQPQATFTSLALAQAEAVSGLVFGDFASSEWVIYARITFVTSSGDTNTGKCRIATGGISYITGSKQSMTTVLYAPAASPHAIDTIVDTYQILSNDYTLVCDKGTAFTITLPVAVIGQIFNIKNIGDGEVTVSGYGGTDTIDGATTKALAKWASVTVQCYAANKWVIL